MIKVLIRDIHNNTLDQCFFMSQPKESQLQAYWIESIYKYGALIMLQIETRKYIEI